MEDAPGRRLVAAATALAVAGFVVVIAASFVPRYPCALLEHFRPQLALGGIVVAAAAGGVALGLQWLDARWLDAAMVALLVDACVIVPDLASARREVGEGASVRVLVVNVLSSAEGYDEVRRLIERERPDLVGLIEVTPGWLRELAPALAAYPARIEAPRTDNFGMALYARGALAGGAEYLETTLPAILAEAVIGEVRLGVALLHPHPPLTEARRVEQLRHFDAVAARVHDLGAPFVVMGDLNATPWSRAYARLRGAIGACDTRAGFGAQATYPAGGGLLGIPIDHVLVACAIGVRDRRVGPDVGSDHLPVAVELVVPR